MIDPKARRDFAEEVVRRLRQAGFQGLWAGGCVRDILLGLTPADYDVATDATPDQVMRSLPYKALTMGVSFGVVRVRHPRIRGNEVEIATFRSDLEYLDGRRPSGVVFSSPQADAERRDFTINGMFMDPLEHKVIDYVGGRADLESRVLRAIGEPAARFEEDRLRLLRAVRFAARFDMRIEPKTLAAIQAMAGQVVSVSPERIRQELQRMLIHRNRATAMAMAMDLGLISAILPDLAATKGIFLGKPMEPEADAWDHALRVIDLLPNEPSFPLVFAALIHKVGAASGHPLGQDNEDPLNRDRIGGSIADEICRRLRFSNAERERVVWLVTHHRSLEHAGKLRESTLKRILASPGIDELLALHRADALAMTGKAEHVAYCEHYLRDEPAGPINPPPLLTGDDLKRHGLKPGAHFAVLLERLRDAQLERRVNDKRAALEWLDRESAVDGPL